MKVFGHTALRLKLLQAASDRKLHPVSIFGGPRGVGKRTTALSIAQALVCEECQGTPEACEACGPCLRIQSGQSEALLFISPTSAQLKIEDVRPIHEFLRHKSWTQARIVIIDDAHLLNPTAANHLLKILEEPPTGAFFFLVTDHPHALLPTLRSRSQIYRFGPLSPQDLKQVTGAPDWAIRASYGRADVALRLVDEGDENLRTLALELIASLLKPSFTGFSQLLKEKLRDRGSAVQALGYAQQILRDHLGGHAPAAAASAEALNQLPRLSILELFDRCVAAERDIESNGDRQLAIENLWFDFHPTGPAGRETNRTRSDEC